MSPHTPPSFSLWLIRQVTPPSAEGLVGDLTEEFVSRLRAEGPRRARTWFRFQVVCSIPALIRLRILERGRHVLLTFSGGIVAYLISLMALYGLFSLFSLPGEAPLGGLSAPAFLAGWVFGGSALGTLLAAWVVSSPSPEADPARVAAVGCTASLLLLVGIDEAMTMDVQVVIAAVAVGGALAGEALLRLGRHLPNPH